MKTLWHDVRYAVRALLRQPGFTLVAVVTLALGVGANTAIFSVVNAVMLRPLPYGEPERLVFLWENNQQAGANFMSISLPNLRDWKEQSRSFEQIGATRNASFTITGGGEPERVQGEQAEADMFAALGTRPLLGRAILPEDDRPGGERAPRRRQHPVRAARADHGRLLPVHPRRRLRPRAAGAPPPTERGKKRAASNHDEGTVSSRSWSPPRAGSPGAARVWRPPAAATDSRPSDEITAREKPKANPAKKGGISFDDDDLADYMHPDDVPPKDDES